MNLQYSLNNGLQIQGIDTNSPIILDNDQIQDSNEAFFLWLKAHKGELKVVGNVATKDGHHQGQSLDYTYSKWMEVYKAFTDTGLKGVPVPVRGNSGPFRGSPENSAGADLIISEAKKCSPQRPLFILVGGQCSTVASAIAKDKSIIPNILVVHVDGKGNTQYNDINHEASTYLMDNGVSYLNWSGDLYGWYPGAGYTGWANAGGKPINRMPGFTFPTNINNPFYNIYRSNIARVYDAYGSTGDSPPAAYLVDHSIWQNVVRKTKNNQTVTGAYDYLLVSQNKWADYGPILAGFMNNPENYKQGTTPPVNVAPSVQITNTQTTLNEGLVTITAVSSDPDGTISKVEFFNGTTKLGEDTASPYSFNWNAIKGTHVITARATDNQGATTTSMAVTFTINDVVTEPPPTGTVTVGTTTTLQPGQPATVESTPTQTGIALNFGIPQGIPGQNATGSGSQPRAYFVANAVGDGITDDTVALQSWIDNVIKFNGFGILPSPAKFYKITRTLNMGPVVNQQSYAWFDIQGSGQPGYTIVYMGPSNQPAIKMYGFKGGSIRGLRVKIGDGITGSACWDIGTMAGTTSNSTSGFSFYDCSVELNKGVNNVGFRIGSFGGAGDVSQIVWNNCTAWGGGGVSGASIPGQAGWQLNGNNALQFTWIGGSSSFADKAVELNAGGAMYFFGFGGSQNKVDFYLNHSNTLVTVGNRWESGKQHVVTTSRASHMSITETGSAVADYMPDNGRLYELRQPGTLILDGLKIEKRREINRPDFGSEMIYMESSGMGSLHVRGGAFHAAEPFYTLKNPGTWSINIEGVGKMDANYNSTTQFQNK